MWLKLLAFFSGLADLFKQAKRLIPTPTDIKEKRKVEEEERFEQVKKTGRPHPDDWSGR